MHTNLRHGCALAICVTLILSASPAGATRAPYEPPGDRTSVIVFFERGTGETRMRETLADAGVDPLDIDVRRDDMVLVTTDSDVIASHLAGKIGDSHGVTSVGIDGTVRALESVPPSDPAYLGPEYPQRDYLGPSSVATNSVHVEPVWDATFNGEGFALTPGRKGVPVAVIDTGATPSLLEDTGDYVGVWDYVNGDADPSDDASAIGYHGTRVASVIRAETDNDFGIAGVLHDLDARLLVYKALNSYGSGSSADCMQAMRDAADDGAKVINTSFGERATTYSGAADATLRAAWQDTVDYCVSHGALVVAASGNDAKTYTPVFYPAACDGALAVGSIDVSTGLRSDYSCYGPELDIVAPGRFHRLDYNSVIGMWTTLPSGSTDQGSSGTSFAAPVASGCIAYLWSLVPDRTMIQMRDLVTTTADGSYGSSAGFDLETGWGLLDTWAAYEEMTSTIPAQAPVNVSAGDPNGLDTRLSWTAAAGTGVSYLYGYDGGPAYATTTTSGRLVLPGSGEHTVWVRSFAGDRWGAQTLATDTVTAGAGFASITSTRLAGDDRYATAVAVSEASFPRDADSAVVALGTNWPDALAAGVLAARSGGPLLLTRADSVPISTRDELRRIDPGTVYVVGGTAAVRAAVEDDLHALLPLGTRLIRLGGADRYETARLIALEITGMPGESGSRVVIASGENYPDAMSAAPVAAAAGWPILLTRTATLPDTTRDALTGLETQSTVVIGGTNAVSASVMAALPVPQRWAGADRYETSRVIADQGRALGLLDSPGLGFATGTAFPDALSAGPHAAANGIPVLLTNGVTAPAATWLESSGGGTESIALYGGPSALPYDLEFDLMVALRRP